MNQRKYSFEDTDSLELTLLRPWSFLAPSDSKSDGMEQPLIADAAKESHSSLVRHRSLTTPRQQFEAEPTIRPPGWWNDQMLFDRSLRSMAMLMTLYASILTIICIAFFKDFVQRGNPNSTSVGQHKGKSCKSLRNIDIVIQLVINIAATTILGMSNTYQQLVTSLSMGDIRWALLKFGDCRVGTNSPSTINRKQNGKRWAWLAWLLLVSTSVPIHFFANSVIGPSVFLIPPRDIAYKPIDDARDWKYPPDSGHYNNGFRDEACWVLFQTGSYTPLQNIDQSDLNEMRTAMQYTHVDVFYPEADCSPYVNHSSPAELAKEMSNNSRLSSQRGNCSAEDVTCTYSEPSSQQCRLSIRMSAAFLLTACLVIKAIYMLTVNYQGRRRKKTQCLTFGDVIVASSMDPTLIIKGECMVNGGEAYRHSTDHKCHKHCSAETPSVSGDELGHCQKCSKHNEINRAANLPQPCIATKYKKSLISNLGSTALRQMIILSLSSAALLGVSLVLAFFFGAAATGYKYNCANPTGAGLPAANTDYEKCMKGRSAFLAKQFGSFGGFESAAAIGDLDFDRASSEVAAFAISNGAQLLYSLLYLLLVYNVTLVSMEYDWGQLEKQRGRLRCTLVRGKEFDQSYLLQLPKVILFPIMGFSSLMHWLLGQAISTKELIISGKDVNGVRWERSGYSVIYGVYAIWLATILMVAMTGACYWAFSYTREGFIPQMYGSIRVCCAATTELDNYTDEGIQWGDLGTGERFRHAGLSADTVKAIVPAELYSGTKYHDMESSRTLKPLKLD